MQKFGGQLVRLLAGTLALIVRNGRPVDSHLSVMGHVRACIRVSWLDIVKAEEEIANTK